jgi:DNA-directed RNA polymerase subunit delta
MEKSMLDVAYDILEKSKGPLKFADLMKKVASEKKMSDDEMKIKMAQFYTNLSIDGRFVVMSDNSWDLRKRVAYANVHIDMNDAYNDIDIDDDDDDDDAGDKEEAEEEKDAGESDDAPGDDESEKELGDDDGAPIKSEDNYDDEDDGNDEDTKAEKAKKELGV